MGFCVKELSNEKLNKLKARIVDKRFLQVVGFGFLETFSTIVKFGIICIVLTIALTYKCSIMQLDGNNIFFKWHTY